MNIYSLIGISIFLFTYFPLFAQQENTKMDTCDEWLKKIDPSIRETALTEKNIDSLKLDKKITIRIREPQKGFLQDNLHTDEQIVEAIECFLTCKGNKKKSSVSGATNMYVSQIFPKASVELAALFYISYLYTANYTFADGIALWSKEGGINPPRAIEIAYDSYKKWFKKVQEIGLSAARKMELNPLEGTGLSWY